MLFAWLALATPTTLLAVSATPPVHRAGANHHLGDDSFVARFGRLPVAADSELLRMRVHLKYVRQQLVSRQATAPELEARRALLLGYLDEYIAKGTTPVNTHVPWRNPVFIDARGTICAVGYLIERSSGRALAERIAAKHRLDYLEDIVAAMPEVSAWVASSGFTLTELASIQPGYPGPDVMHLSGWISGKPDDIVRTGRARPMDGAYRDADGFEGRFANGQMVGEWRQTQNGVLTGRGTFQHGAGTWKSLRSDGTLLATGPFRASRADGAWRIFHPGGRVAAAGNMRGGKRDGTWRFHHDAHGQPLLAVGQFERGEALGAWKHYAIDGTLIATASGRAGKGFTLDGEPGRDRVRRTVRQGLPADSFRVDGFYLGGDRLYLTNEGNMFDADGNVLEQHEGVWRVRACQRPVALKTAARTGNIRALFPSLYAATRDDTRQHECAQTATPVPGPRAQHYQRMLTSLDSQHAPIPGFNVDPVWQKSALDQAPREDWQTALEQRPATGNPRDMVTYLASHMTWYIEFPHVDRTFERVYASLPGYNADTDQP